MAMQNLESIVAQIDSAVAVVSTEVNDLIARLQNGSGLTADEASQLATELQASLAKIQAIAPAP